MQCDKYLGKQFVERFMLNNAFRNRINFYPSYVINDSIFEIMNYIFSVSQYIHYVRESMKDSVSRNFELKAMIITKSVRSVYDNDILYHYAMKNISIYLESKNISEYHRNPIKTTGKYANIFDMVKSQYDIDDIIQENITNMIIIIDRRNSRKQKDFLYAFTCENFDDFKALNRDYFIGFDFHIIPRDNNQNTVSAYLRYGIDEVSRFYPEILVSFIPRIFCRTSDIYPDALYQLYDKYLIV
eukprot:143292_1